MFFIQYLLSLLSLFFTINLSQCAPIYDKWIVVTTIQYPTPALKKLASLKNWQLVVLGDKKTPKDWHLDNCIYLDVEAQKQLPYNIIPHLPWNHYCKKKYGYLYAIEHGASIIYETDDDNIVLNDIEYLPEKTTLDQVMTQQNTINVYALFGQPNVWPRGYPLSKVTSPNNYSLSTTEMAIPIQQGLVNGDPDVDAIFRLTHEHEISFDNRQPICLQPKTMCPFNTQNTLFHYRAFWGLLIPITTSFRVCDIWRGYWVQRLLWDIDASLCFLSPTAVQYRNQHDLLQDFSGELDLYLKTEKLIEALNEWNSDAQFFDQRMKDLMNFLIKGDFFKVAEFDLVEAWIKDLQNLNYEMPNLNQSIIKKD